jgi:glycosyltransferase involved in cell wall biosynthesis
MGGAERYLELLAAGIGGYGYTPVMITGSGEGLEPLRDSMRGMGIEVFALGPARRVGRRIAVSLIDVLRRIGPAIFHFNLPGPFDARYGIVAPMARMAGVRAIVSTEHLPMVPSFFKARILRGFSSRFVSRVITVSEDNRRHLIENHRVADDKIRVVYNGIPPSRESATIDLRRELGLGADSLLVAMVGALEARKGHATLFEALTRLPAPVHAVVVGTGETEGQLRDASAEMGITHRVHFAGYRDDVPCIMRSVDMLAVPSILEATPYVILEAMEAGLPVIASSIYGIPELVGDDEAGILIPASDADALAAAIGRLGNDHALRESMGRHARERYQARFTLERCLRDTIEVYRELIRG